MNRIEKFEFYGVASLAAVLPTGMLAGILLLPSVPDRSCYPTAVPPAAWYFPSLSRQAARGSVFEDGEAFREVYAPDIFASFRGYPLPGGNSESLYDELPCLKPLAAPAPAVDRRAAEGGRGKNGIDMGDSADMCSRPAFARAPAKAGAVHAASIFMGDSLKNRSFEQDPLQGMVVPAEGKPWSLRVEICFDASGGIEHVFAEPEGCNPELCREIVARLYRARIAGVTTPGHGMLIVSCPSSGGGQGKTGSEPQTGRNQAR